MTEIADAELVSVARELYAHAPAEFIATRNARAAAARRAGDRELATQIKALPKASVAAWAVGAVAREHPEDLDALGQLGAELRVAQVAADPAELRALGRRRRELTGAVTRTAARLAEEHGVGLSAAAQEQVEATWSAVVIDRDAERAVRSLLLVRALEPSGGLEDALVVPGAVEVAEPEEEPAPPSRRPRPAPARTEADDDDAEPRRAISRRPRSVEREEEPEAQKPTRRAISRQPRSPEPGEKAEQTPPRRAISRRPRSAEPEAQQTRPQRAIGRTRRSAPEPTPEPADTAREIRRAERELRARERVAEHARAELEDAAEELSRIEAQVLQAAARTEELRRELEALEEQLAELDEERTQAAEEREDAEAREQAARHAVEEARERLGELTD